MDSILVKASWVYRAIFFVPYLMSSCRLNREKKGEKLQKSTSKVSNEMKE